MAVRLFRDIFHRLSGTLFVQILIRTLQFRRSRNRAESKPVQLRR